jgi:polysaccharide deacetylase family protein (PEP-CTERM system associated)
MRVSTDQPAAFSVDLEDYYHAQLVRERTGKARLPSRVEVATAPILELLERHGVRATFFVVGEVARDAPRLIERIVRSGHEIGCHTYSHDPLWDMTPESFREDIRKFKAEIRAVAGDVPVRGFRAPTFSLDEGTAWALPVLAEEGFTYDSSIVPARGPLYGCPGAPIEIYRPSSEDLRVADPAGRLVEFPAPVVALPGSRFPVGGGIYLRALPFRIYHALVRRVLRRRPFFLYVHPWETDPGTPRLDLPRLARWATYTGISGMMGKLERLLRSIRFTTMSAAIESWRPGA